MAGKTGRAGNWVARRLKAHRRRWAERALGRAACVAEPLESRVLLSVAAPVGGEFLVNTTTADTQIAPAIGMDPAGNFVVAWMSNNQDGDRYGAYAQRYNSAGVPTGGEFQVNTTAFGNQASPAVAMDSAADFVIAWSSPDGSGNGIFAQRYDSAGIAQGGEFQVNSTIANNQQSPVIAMDGAGDFVVTWTSYTQDGDRYGVYAQRYNFAASPQGVEFLVNTTTKDNQRSPVATMDSAGNFVVAWESNGQDGSSKGIYAQRYDSSGVAEGGEFLVNTTTINTQALPSIGMDPSGDFAIAWDSYRQDGSGDGIYAQRYDPEGHAEGGEFRVNTTISGDQRRPAVKMDAAGNFVVAWTSYTQDGSGRGIYAQRYDPAGMPVGGEIRVNTTTANDQNYAAVAVDASGDFVVTWQSYAQDGSRYGVYAQRYDVIPSPATVAGRVWNDVDGDGVQELSEVGVDGVRVTLVTSRGEMSNSATTAGGGLYSFDNILPGDAQSLYFALPSGFVFTLQNTGGDVTVDSDVLPDGSLEFTAAAGQILTHIDAGLAPEAMVSGLVFSDSNGDGVQQAGEVPLPGWIVYGDVNGNGVLDATEQSAVSAADGTYTIKGLARGAYSIRQLSQDNWTAGARPVSPMVGQNLTGVDLANRTTAPSIVSTAAGAEFRPNTTTVGSQAYPSIAMNAAGDLVAIWKGTGIRAQLYDSSGAKKGVEFRVDTTNAFDEFITAVAMDAVGNFIVVWESLRQDLSYIDIDARLFNAAGVPLGNEFIVNTTTVGEQHYPSVAMNSAGNFVVVWQQVSKNFARIYNAAGVAQSGEISIPGTTVGGLPNSKVALDAAGNFVVAWPTGNAIKARRYNAAGVAQAPELLVNQTSAGWEANCDVAMDSAGDFVVAWTRLSNPSSSIYAQRYNSAGIAQGGEFRVDKKSLPEPNVGLVSPLTVRMDALGDFAIAWTGRDKDNYGVYGRLYNSAGVAQGVEFLINATTTGVQFAPALGMDSSGDFVVAWTGRGVFAQRFNVSGPLQLVGTIGSDSIYAKAEVTNIKVWINHNPVSDQVDIVRSLTQATGISIVAAGTDTLKLDYSGGNFPGPIQIDGIGGADTLNIIGNGSGTLAIIGGTVNVVGDAAGLDVVVSNSAQVNFGVSQHPKSLSLLGNAVARLAGGGGYFIRTGLLSLAGAAGLDLNDGDLILQSSAGSRAADLAMLAGLIQSGRNGGKGITSSVAASEPNKLTGLAIALNDKGNGSVLYPTFDGELVDANSILIKYTYNGDADLSGKIGADDYFQIDNGFVQKATGYRNGDFDFNGSVDADDYFLIDRAFAGQTGVLATHPPAASVATKVSQAPHHRRGRHHYRTH